MNSRRNFLLNFLFWTLSFIFSYRVGNLDIKSGVLSEELAETEQQLDDMAINIVSLGADKTGNTDIVNVLIEAINKLASAGGGRILFPQGTYLFSGLRIGSFEGITNTGNVPVIAGIHNITFEGIGKAIIKLPNEANNDLFVFRFLNNITFKNITLDGNSANQTGIGGYKGFWDSDLTGILARDGKTIELEKVTLKNCLHFGANISSDFNNVKITKCSADNCATGIDVQGSIMTIEKNSFTNCTIAGLMLEGEDLTNDFNIYSGLNSFISVSKNYIKGCTRGVYVTGNAYSVNIKTNTILNSSIWGISINGSSLTSGKRIDTITCEDNTIYSCGDGINISQAINQKLSKNTIRKNTRGIYCYNVVESELENNKVKENNGSGMFFEGGSKNILVNGNDVLNNNLTSTGKFAGLFIFGGSDFRLLNNVFSDTQTTPTQQYGVILDGNPSNVTIDNNEFQDNVQTSLSDWLGSSQYSWINNNADKC